MIIISSLFFFTCAVAAQSDDVYKQFLKDHPMSQYNIISYCCRYVGWGIIRFLRWIVDALQSGIVKINENFNNIFDNDKVKDLIEKVKVLAIGLFAIALAYIGFEYIFKKDKNKNFNTYAMNFVIGVIVFIGISTAISDLYEISSTAITKYLDVKTESLASDITLSNITDNLLYKNFSVPDKKNNFSSSIDENTGKSELDYVNINEWILTSEGDPFCKYIGPYGKLENIDEGPGIGDWHLYLLGNLYYRWNVNWFEIIVELIIMGFTLVIMSIKIARLSYELVIHQMMAQALAFLDIHSGLRLKKCLQSIVATFVTFFGCFLLLQLYIAGNDFINGVGFNPLTKILCMLALAISVVDGPNLFEQIIGIDAGLNSTTSAILSAHGIMGGLRALGKGAKGLSHIASGAKKAANMAGHAAGAAAGAVAGKKAFKSGMNPLPFQKNSDGTADGGSKAEDKSDSNSTEESQKGLAETKDSQSTAKTSKTQEGVNKHMPKTLGDQVKNYVKNKVMNENSPAGHAKKAYNLTKEAALHSAAKKAYIKTRASELNSKSQAKKDYKENMDKHFGG